MMFDPVQNYHFKFKLSLLPTLQLILRLEIEHILLSCFHHIVYLVCDRDEPISSPTAGHRSPLTRVLVCDNKI